MAKKKKSRSGLIITLLLLGIIVVGAVLWMTVFKKEPPVFVSVEPVGTRTIVQTVNAIGKIQPEFMVKISSEARSLNRPAPAWNQAAWRSTLLRPSATARKPT